ncbi:MAG: hypothetical protein C5B50_19505 [Verrucomicrobia bacterium]|nr:MAG: hypothetical protein C5B50_19505 [Verrucomicrobiota bacterium]
MLNLNIIRARIRDEFKPFTLYLSDGRKIPVPHPEFISVGQAIVVVIGPDDVPQDIDPLHIVSLKETPRKKARPSRGQKR